MENVEVLFIFSEDFVRKLAKEFLSEDAIEIPRDTKINSHFSAKIKFKETGHLESTIWLNNLMELIYSIGFHNPYNNRVYHVSFVYKIVRNRVVLEEYTAPSGEDLRIAESKSKSFMEFIQKEIDAAMDKYFQDSIEIEL